MTLENAIRELMEKGVTQFVGWTAQAALDNAICITETAHRVIETGIGDVKSHQYTLDHADDHFIIEPDGHHIICTWYETGDGQRFCMATYGDYDTEKEMRAAFDEWKIAKEAAEIADRMMVERPGEFTREGWLLIATSELRAAYKAADEVFDRLYENKEE